MQPNNSQDKSRDQVEATRRKLREMNEQAGHGGPQATAAIEAANDEIDRQTGRK